MRSSRVEDGAPLNMQDTLVLPPGSYRLPAVRVGKLQVGLLLLSVTELLLAGSGRPLEVGPVTARMIIFGIALVYGYASLFRREVRVSADIALTFIFGALALIVGTLVGVLNSNGDDFIFLDLRYYACFLSLPFFLVTVTSLKVVLLLRKLIRWCALALAVGYGGVQFLIMVGILNAGTVRAFTDSTADFTPRAAPEIRLISPVDFQMFFYSGFIFLGVGVILYACEETRASRALAAFVALMLFCTLTRGFIVSLGGVALLYAVLNRRSPLRNILLVITAAVFSIASLIVSTDADRELSDTVRMRTMTAVLDRLTPGTLFWGHGFGKNAPADARNAEELRKFKLLHVENSYVEVLDKQGLLGLSFYAAVLVVVTRQFLRLRRTQHHIVAEGFFLGTVYVFLVSMFNPYVNNSIGMTFVCISIATLAALEQDVRRTVVLKAHFASMQSAEV